MIEWKEPIEIRKIMWYNIKAIRTSILSVMVFPQSGDFNRVKNGGGKFLILLTTGGITNGRSINEAAA